MEAAKMIQTTMKAALVVAAAAAALLMAACSPPAAATGPTAVADGVKFDYGLTPGEKAGAYHVKLALADAKTGAAIRDANVALNLYGPGLEGDSLINLKRTDGGYGADVELPKAANYRLTFQVNRAPQPSAQAVFAAAPPTAG